MQLWLLVTDVFVDPLVAVTLNSGRLSKLQHYRYHCIQNGTTLICCPPLPSWRLIRVPPWPLTVNLIMNVFSALIQLTESMISYLANVHAAPKVRIALSSELAGLLNLLQLLDNRLKASNSSDPWLSSIRALDQLRHSLQKLVTKLGGTSAIAMAGRSLTWKFDKAEIKDILQRVERIKSLVSLALTDDLR
jgi:hypothetical protein